MKTTIIILAIIAVVLIASIVIGLCLAAGKTAKIMENIMDETHEQL